MSDQASRLRWLMFDGASPSAPPDAHAPALIVVGGGKGGVGTTTIAVNLAAALALDGRRTMLVDADLGRADAAALCGAEGGYTLADVLAGRRDVHEVLVRGPAGVSVLPGAWAGGQIEEYTPAAQERLLRGLSRLGAHAEFVVLDVGSGRHRMARQFWQAADDLLFVTTSDEASIVNTYGAIKLLAGSAAPARVHVLLNLAVDAAAAAAAHERLRRACRRFLAIDLLDAGRVPLDPQFVTAARSRIPLAIAAPDRAAAAALAALASRLAEAKKIGQIVHPAQSVRSINDATVGSPSAVKL